MYVARVGGFVYVIKTWSGWVTSSLGVLAPVDELHCLPVLCSSWGWSPTNRRP